MLCLGWTLLRSWENPPPPLTDLGTEDADTLMPVEARGYKGVNDLWETPQTS